jgi:cyclic pyranopterin phosphate synthase
LTGDNSTLSHVNAAGEANMVDVSTKEVTERTARARAVLRMAEATARAIQTDTVSKGEVLAVARVAGIQGAKRCADLIPLCHPLPLSKVQVDFTWLASSDGAALLAVDTLCKVSAQTGVEMEALTAASIAALTVYDMCKAIDRGMRIEQLGLLEKRGGKSGDWLREDANS